MPIAEPLYKYNQWVLTVYGCGNHKKLKLTRMNVLRTAGLDVPDDGDPGGYVHDGKLDESIRRSKAMIYELAFCNPWEHFFTGTIDPVKYDRTELKAFYKKLGQYVCNLNKQGCSIKYLLIPELHSDGKSWHLHGLLHDMPFEALEPFEIGDRMGRGIAAKVSRGEAVFNWPAYAERFGFCDLEPIRDADAVSKYVTKYITKDMSRCVTEVGAHTYYCSKGLNRAKTIKRGSMDIAVPTEQVTNSYTNDYCDVYWLAYSDELLQELSAHIIRQ